MGVSLLHVKEEFKLLFKVHIISNQNDLSYSRDIHSYILFLHIEHFYLFIQLSLC